MYAYAMHAHLGLAMWLGAWAVLMPVIFEDLNFARVTCCVIVMIALSGSFSLSFSLYSLLL